MDFTASDTAKLTSISLRSINRIYIKLRKKLLFSVNKYHLSMVLLNWMNPISELIVYEVNEVVGHQVKPLYLDYSNGMEMNIQKICKIVTDFSKATLQGIIRGHIELD